MAEEKQKKSTFKKEADGTIALTITIPQDDIKKAWAKQMQKAVENTTIEGFRKGKAPAKLVEKQVDTDKVREEVLRDILPKHYSAAILEQNSKPIISPKIHIEKTEEGSDWEFTAITCEKPEVKLKDYKKAVQNITAKSKIIIPGKEEEKKDVSFDDIAKVLVEAVEVNIPQILIDGEVDRLLSNMLDEIKTLGLTLDQYLSSTGKTVEAVKQEFTEKAKQDIILEFALQQVAEEEKIAVEPKEIGEAIQQAKNDDEKAHMQRNVYLLASILRQQKTLDFLKNL